MNATPPPIRASHSGGPWQPGGYGYPPGAPAGGGGGGVPPGPPGARPPKPITGSPETMALHAMSIDPRTGLPRGEKPPASTAAVVALICGILLCLGPLTGVSALIAGGVALKASRARPQEVGGAGLAWVGIALGCLNLVLSALGLVYLLVVYAPQ
ncbi:MAG: DUF4190 domain-containing protein [Polyangiaceae bacterium]